jgi:dTMP kinase
MSGCFITFEGGEGTGKSTQIKLLAARLAARGLPAITTREPGGTPQGEALRGLLLNGDVNEWTATSEALLNYAARAEHMRNVIAPALQKKKVVISDRFMDSTRAYQGHAGKCSLVLIDQLERDIVGAYRPRLTLVFDLDPQVGLARARERGNDAEMRFEKKGLTFHQDIRKAFLSIAKADPKRCTVIDASADIETISTAIWNAVEPVINGS